MADQPGPADSRTVVGRYTLYDAIASGGMATVHVGRLIGPAGFSRTVAVKRMHRQFAKDPDFVGMFLDEARLAAKVRHPHVVSILDVVSTDGEVFLVMDYVEGESLARLMKKTRQLDEYVPLPIASAIISHLLYGLHAAHEATGDGGEALGIVHRDVSPQNVLVGLDGVARVADFGVAKAERRLQATEAGRLKGKLAYMSPEQISAGEVDRRADLFAAGIVAWEVLTGKRLFTSDKPMGIAELVKNAPIPKPSSENPEVGPELDAIVLRALERDPNRRFDSAKQMAIAIENALAPAVTRVVGEWVERIAGETLQKRSLLLNELESHEREIQSSGKSLIAKILDPGAAESQTSMLARSGDEPGVMTGTVTRTQPLALPRVDEDAATRTWDPPRAAEPNAEPEGSTSASWDSSRTRDAPPRAASPNRALLLGIAAGLALFVVAGMVLLVTRPSKSVSMLNSGIAHAAVRPAVVTADVSPPVDAPAPTEAPKNTARVATKTARPPTAKPTAAPNCNPPYVRGDDGIVHFKRECLK